MSKKEPAIKETNNELSLSVAEIALKIFWTNLLYPNLDSYVFMIRLERKSI